MINKQRDWTHLQNTNPLLASVRKGHTKILGPFLTTSFLALSLLVVDRVFFSLKPDVMICLFSVFNISYFLESRARVKSTLQTGGFFPPSFPLARNTG